MKITNEDLSKLKIDSENHFIENTFATVETRASAYLAIESIHQLRNSVKNSIIVLVCGFILGLLPNYIIVNNREQESHKEIKNLQQQVKKLQDLILHSDKCHSKKYSEQTSSKKN